MQKTRASAAEDFRPHDAPIDLNEIKAALADLNPIEGILGLSVPLEYTRRPEGSPLAGTVDTIEIGPFGGTGNWMLYTGRAYHGDSPANVTAVVGTIPGHMVVLVARALHTHLSAAGTQGRADTVEGDILYALGLVRPLTVDGTAYPVGKA